MLGLENNRHSSAAYGCVPQMNLGSLKDIRDLNLPWIAHSNKKDIN
jgi:hypothetical protein